MIFDQEVPHRAERVYGMIQCTTVRPLGYLLLVLTPHLLLAQPQTGELEARLAEAAGEDRIQVLLELAGAWGAADPARALGYAGEATELARGVGDEALLIRSLELVAAGHLGLDEVDDALVGFREALKLSRATGESHSIAGALLAIGGIHLDAGRLPAAATTLERALAAETELASPRPRALQEIHFGLADAYARLGRHREAHQALSRHAELAAAAAVADSEHIAELEAQLEAGRERRENDAARHRREMATRRQELTEGPIRSRSMTGAAIAGGIGLAALLLSLVSRYRLKAGLARTVADRDLELDETSGQLDRAMQELEQTRADLAATSSRLRDTAHELERTGSELGRVKSALDEVEAKHRRATFELNRTSSDLEQATAKLERTSNELDQVSAVRDRTAVQLAETSSQLDQTADELAETLRRLSSTGSELAQVQQSYREDISELGDRNAVTRDRLEEMERFTSTVAQHLKVLLVSIRSAFGTLQQDATAGDLEQLRADVDRTQATVGRVVRLLDKLLKLLLVGRLVNAPAEMSMSELAFEAAGQVAGLVSNRLAEIVIAPDMPSVVGDRPQLLEMLRNLLENGGRFMGEQQAPKIEVGCRQDGELTVFFVRDNGIGIDRRDQARIFTLFERLEPARGGDGLGLGLVKRIVETHGGRVWAESEGEGHGSTFCFTLSATPGEIGDALEKPVP